MTAAASGADAGIHRIILGLGNGPSSSASHMTTLIISNDEIHDIIKIVKSLEDSDLLSKKVTETVQNEVKKQKGGFPSALSGTLGASLLGDLLIGKGIYRGGKGINRAGEGFVGAGYGNNNNIKMDF